MGKHLSSDLKERLPDAFYAIKMNFKYVGGARGKRESNIPEPFSLLLVYRAFRRSYNAFSFYL